MLFFLLLTLSGILALLEKSILPIPITAIFIIFLSIWRSDSMPLLAGFISGILLDFFGVESIGLSSSVLVVTAFVIGLYKRKFQAQNIFFIFSSTLGSLSLFLLVTNGFPLDIDNILKALIISSISTMFWIFYTKMKQYEIWT